MKKFILLAIFLITMVGQAMADLNAEQTKLQSTVIQFLKEEGFQPEIDSDGDIKVKIQGTAYYVSIPENNTNPMFITISSYFNKPSDYAPLAIELSTVELNRYKGIKVQIFEKSIRIVGEMFVRNAEPFMQAFYKIVSIMQEAENDLIQECENAQKALDQYCSGAADSI